MLAREELASWRIEARTKLLEARGEDSSWGYRFGGERASEPTALVGLAFCDPANAQDLAIARRAAFWLAARQRGDGSLGSSVEPGSPGWPSAHALWLWNALNEPTLASARDRAVAYLLEARGETMPKDPAAVVRHDTTLAGWPWVDGTHSWLEPTATALLALVPRIGGDHPRIVEAARLIQDRAIESGGWNYGNRLVFNTPLRPQPATTGLALVALARVRETVSVDQTVIRRAVAFLRRSIDRTASPTALAWGVLGLRAWRAAPSSTKSSLARAADLCGSKPDFPAKLACLRLADAEDGLLRFGIH